ncbi:hypothetical protein [Microcoleus sp. herbarium2]|uniref:hypothetical protein n=1 Tax=Microcoleus sp. herbarium2 TaxID=3055433 RepID=UPI002FD5515C
MDNKEIGKYELSVYFAVLASQFELAKNLNSMAGQARAERAWSVISRFYDNCNKHKPGKEGHYRFTKRQAHGFVEYETSRWKLSRERRYSLSLTILKREILKCGQPAIGISIN